MAKDKKSFILYSDLLKVVEKLPDEMAGKLFKIILRYVNDLEVNIDDLLLDIAFEPIKLQLKRDLLKFEEVKIKRSEAGKRSAELRALKKEQQTSTNPTSVKNVQQVSTNPTDSVNENDTVNVTVNVNDILLKKETKESVTKFNYDEIFLLYEETCKDSPKIKIKSDSRKKLIKGFVLKYKKEKIKEAFDMVYESDFLSCRTDKNFQATFDWIFNHKNFAKIIEGNYENKTNGSNHSTASQFNANKQKAHDSATELFG